MSFQVFSHLINKNSNKGVDQVINYMNTNPLFMHKPHIDKNPINEPSIRAYYNIKTVDNGVDPTAYAEFTRDKYHSQDLIFKNYNKKTLIDDLQTGTGNYANNFVEFKRAYLNNDGKPLIRNNTMLAGLYMNENNTPTNVPYTPSGPLPDPSSGGPDPSFPPAPTAPAPAPAPPPPPPAPKKGSQPPPPPPPPPPKKGQSLLDTPISIEDQNRLIKEYSETKEKKKKAAITLQSATKRFVSRKKLEGIRAVKTSTIQPVEETTSTQPAEVKPEPVEPDSPKSDDTIVEDPPKMKEHKTLLETNYEIPKSITNMINYRGSIEKIGILNAIAKELYTRNRTSEFLEAVATSTNTSSGKRSLKTPTDLQSELGTIKKLQVVK